MVRIHQNYNNGHWHLPCLHHSTDQAWYYLVQQTNCKSQLNIMIIIMDIFKVPALHCSEHWTVKTQKNARFTSVYQFNIHYVHSNTVGEHCSNINDKCNIILGVSCWKWCAGVCIMYIKLYIHFSLHKKILNFLHINFFLNKKNGGLLPFITHAIYTYSGKLTWTEQDLQSLSACTWFIYIYINMFVKICAIYI